MFRRSWEILYYKYIKEALRNGITDYPSSLPASLPLNEGLGLMSCSGVFSWVWIWGLGEANGASHKVLEIRTSIKPNMLILAISRAS